MADLLKRAMLPIPVETARSIATDYGYDQVIVIGRRVGEDPDPHGEHIATAGVGAAHAAIAADAGRALQRFMGWPLDPVTDPVVRALNAAVHALRSYQHGNSAPDLAATIAAAGEQALIEVGLQLSPPTGAN